MDKGTYKLYAQPYNLTENYKPYPTEINVI